MRIRTNIPALNAQFKLRENHSNLTKNLEKLSSGYMINRAGDDAAGLAISEKMRALITGLNRAVLNTEDGISLIRTGEGALQEVHVMLNRLSKLAVQSANGIYNDEINRANLQQEADEICDEIDHIARTTNFNNINLFQDEGYHAERTVSSQATAPTLEEVLADTGDTLKNIIYTETIFDFETDQAPCQQFSKPNNFTDLTYRNIANTLQTSMVPQVVTAIMEKYTAFNYLTGSSIGIGLELYSDNNASVLASALVRPWVSTASDGTRTGVALGYSLRVNVAKIGDLSNAANRSYLEQTIAHEMIHVFMEEATTVGMTGVAPSGDVEEFPSWFVEGMAQTASGPGNWTRGSSLHLTANSTHSEITNAINTSSSKLGSGGTASQYGTGYLACMYLGYLASGKTANMNDPTAAATAITQGVSSILSKLIEGKSLTKVINETTGGKYTSIGSFQNGFASDPDALDFIQKLLKYTSYSLDNSGNAALVGGGLLSGSLSNGNPVADTPLSGLKLFALDTNNTEIKNEYPSDITILSGGGATVDGVKPTTSVPPVTPITYPSGVFTVSGGTEGTDWRFDTATGALHILTGKDLQISGGTLTNASGTYYGNIVIDDGIDANITLAGVSIDASKKTGNVAGILLGNGCDVKIAVNGTNTVAGGGEAAGIQLAGNQDSSVTLDLTAGSVLTATGGAKSSGYPGTGGAGIGAANATDTSKGNITIGGQGTLNAYGGEGAAGIGGSYWGSIGDIRILGTGLNITSVGGEHGAGIGGGWANGNHTKSNVKSITISGEANINASSKYHGTGIGGGCQGMMGDIIIGDSNSDNSLLYIQATGGDDGAAIGSGGLAGSVDNITIHGGTITATSGARGAGIGGGSDGTCGDITINGGTITAKGSTNSSGIGGGMYGTVSNIRINGGTITADGGWTYDGGNIGGYTDKSGKNKTTVTIADPSGLTIKAGEKGEGKYITTGTVDSNGNTLYALDMKYISQLIQKGSLVPTNSGTDPKLDFPLADLKVTLKDGTTYSWNSLKHMSENSAYIWAKGEDMTLTFKDADGTEGMIDLKFYADYGLWRFSEDDLPNELPKEPGYVGGSSSNPSRPLASGSLVLQVGPYSDSTFEIPRFYFSKTALRLNEYDISTQDNARNSIEKAEWMINRVSQIRGKYGAIDNALGHIINNLNTGIENISQAESRIRDVDMAKEMMKYTKNNILIQSAQTMLAQANVLPQAVFQLLQ